jgi:hypothetical protein
VTVSVGFRTDFIVQALEYIEEARREIVTEKPSIAVADMKLGWALRRLRVALDIGPSADAINEVVRAGAP